MLKYQSQKIAMAYFAVAMALFVIQVTVGLLIGYVYLAPNTLAEVLPFNILRMLHTNALIVWLVTGFFGIAYFMIPDEAEREIESPMLAWLQLVILVVGTLGAVLTYVFDFAHGNWLFGKQGREFLEQPLWVKLGIVVAALIFLYNVTMTVLKGRKTAIANVLLLGLWGLAVFFLFSLYNPSNLALDKMFWWWVVHLWVEGVWELIMAAVLAYLMLKLTGVDREMVEKWIYGLAALSLFTGILGTGHHYYWIGTPAYWQWIGSIFSAMEVIPFFAMVLFVFTMVWKGQREHPNKAAILWALGCAVLAFFGAGIWGFLHTLAPINYYTHGTQVTMSHGHLAFFGAYVSLNLAFITYAMPYLRGREPYNQVLNMLSFWLMAGGITFMTFALTFAGAVQVHLQRVLKEPMSFMEVQGDVTDSQLHLFYILRELAGVILVIGVALYLYSIFVPREKEVIAPAAKQPAE